MRVGRLVEPYPTTTIPVMGRCDACGLVGSVDSICICGIPLPPVHMDAHLDQEGHMADSSIAIIACAMAAELSAAESSADEEEKDGDVKNDVKYNSSTTDYLPTFFEYFDCVALSSSPNSSVDCCIDGDFFFDAISSSFISDDVDVSNQGTSDIDVNTPGISNQGRH